MSVQVALDDRSSCPECLAVFRGGFLRCPRDGSALVGDDRDPLVGTVLAERYQIESVIGEGGIGRVYRARHVRMSRRYAIKVPFGELAYDAKVRARFLNEAEATSRLQHPNVIGVVDVGESAKGLLYMAMDLAEGVSLAEVIHRDAPISRERILKIATQIGEGLEHAHERGLVHRDLKPENIILVREDDGGERVCLVDFGIAILRDGDGNSGRLTTEGIVLGTPHYMAPEQATNQEIDHRTDLFALGLVVYEMLAGVLPFDGSPIDVARKNLSAEPPRITQRVPGLVVDPYLQALAFWLMEKRPEARPQRAAEVVETLRMIETDPSGVTARLRLGEVAEVVDLPAPKGTIRPRAPLPTKLTREATAPTVEAPPVGSLLPPQPSAGSAPPAGDAEWLATDRVEGKRTWRTWAIAAIVLLALATLIAMLSMSGEHARSVDAGPAVARASVDAGVVAPAPVIDAAPVAEAVIDAAVATTPGSGSGSTRRPDPGHKPRHPPEVKGAGSGTAATPEVKTDEPPSKASLTALYEQVGRQLNKLIADKGGAAAAAFKKRYQAIDYLGAARKPDQRADAMAALRALAKEMPR